MPRKSVMGYEIKEWGKLGVQRLSESWERETLPYSFGSDLIKTIISRSSNYP